jgi:phosphoribosyl-ATP pyrophosphohydrolase/phosphoribosyl-AMP cyclohydrolase
MCENLKPDFTKTELLPAIVQDATTKNVLMQGYMNQEAFDKTLETKKVTFFSRSKSRLWTKGEESGHFLHLVDLKLDCDNDSILIKANPVGPTCHTGTDTCWGETNKQEYGFISQLEAVINGRYEDRSEKSYTSYLFEKGINKIAQKVGEEAVEVVIESKDNNDDLFKNESADLLYHLLVLLRAKNISFDEIIQVLKERHK